VLFNSLDFALFIAILLPLYYVCRHRQQNRLLLVASYIFYGSWDWRFLSLILLSTVIDYTVGRAIQRSDSAARRKSLVAVSIFSNLSLSGVFKYFNFFADSFAVILGSIGFEADWTTLNIVLPVGISFYTFQTMSYAIDVYRRDLDAVDDFFDFALYVAFFPQLVAGPIERAKQFMPQITQPRSPSLDAFSRGLFLILFGLFKKVAIADGLAYTVDPVFESPEQFARVDLLLATYCFAFQIYCDFSGYTDIARGVAKLMGFNLSLNFNLPYVSQNPQEFWRRWHISLSTWLRDYLYIPLGGSRGSLVRTNINLSITMFLGGLWHGAAWNFVVWGVYQGAILAIHRLVVGRRAAVSHGLLRIVWIGLFFQVICYGWLLFRANSLASIVTMTRILLFGPMGTELLLPTPELSVLIGLPLLLMMDWLQYLKGTSHWYRKWPEPLQGILFALMIVVLLMGMGKAPAQFIYFQF